MSNLFKTVRIVHSPLEKRYYVEQKKVWRFTWDRTDIFAYVDKIESSPFGCHDLQNDAFQKAKNRADVLLSRTVVWEQSNYFIH